MPNNGSSTPDIWGKNTYDVGLLHPMKPGSPDVSADHFAERNIQSWSSTANTDRMIQNMPTLRDALERELKERQIDMNLASDGTRGAIARIQAALPDDPRQQLAILQPLGLEVARFQIGANMATLLQPSEILRLTAGESNTLDTAYGKDALGPARTTFERERGEAMARRADEIRLALQGVRAHEIVSRTGVKEEIDNFVLSKLPDKHFPWYMLPLTFQKTESHSGDRDALKRLVTLEIRNNPGKYDQGLAPGSERNAALSGEVLSALWRWSWQLVCVFNLESCVQQELKRTKQWPVVQVSTEEMEAVLEETKTALPESTDARVVQHVSDIAIAKILSGTSYMESIRHSITSEAVSRTLSQIGLPHEAYAHLSLAELMAQMLIAPDLKLALSREELRELDSDPRVLQATA